LTPDEILNSVSPPNPPRLEYGQLLYEFITTNQLSIGLELRATSDISTVYIAGAIEALGGGLLRSVHQGLPKKQDYDVRSALQATGLSDFVSIYEEPKSYSWRLMKFLQEDIYEYFDFCVIDEGTTWAGVGFACCLVERLLKPGGWIILNNLNFSFRESSNRDAAWVLGKQEDEQITRQVRCAFELLIQANPRFGSFRKRGSLAYARKTEAIWSMESRSRNKRDAIICDAVERARQDPEFRADLLLSPQSALSILSYGIFNDIGDVRFIDTDQLGPLAAMSDSEVLVVPLERPSWEKRVDESTLEAMLKE
jgi:hypothetical protein